MRRLIVAAAFGLLWTGSAGAQWRYYDRGDLDRQRTEPYARGDAVDRALRDLDRARSYRFTDHHERKHFDQARKDLIRFQDNWARGKFDRGRLDGAIGNIQHLVNADRVHPRDREMLARDLNDLRELRARGGVYRGYGPRW